MNQLFDLLLLLGFSNYMQILLACIVCMLCWMVAYHCMSSKYFDLIYEAIQEENDRKTVLVQVKSYPISTTLQKELLEIVDSHYL